MKMKAALVTLVLLLMATASMADSSEKWTFEKKLDAMTDEVKAFATIITEDGKGAIVVRCMKNEFDILYISVGQYFSDDPYRLKIRVDKNPATTISGYGSKDNVVFVGESGISSFTGILESGNKILVQSSGYSDNTPTTRSYKLNGSSNAIEKVKAVCGLK